MNAPPKTILVVDDNLPVLSRLSTLVKRSPHTGRIFSGQCYEEAVNLLSSFTIDIAFFDIHLPGRSGMELLQFANFHYPQVSIVMLTNQSHPSVENTCKKLGACYFLDKSKDFPRILSLIDSLSQSVVKPLHLRNA